MVHGLASAAQLASTKLSKLFLFDRNKYVPAVAAAFLLGLCLRYAWAFARPAESGLGEADRVAIALASGRGFADAFRVGQGPTAHLMPVSPSIAAIIYRVAGVHTSTSTFLIATWSIGLCLTSYIFLNRAFARVGISQRGRMIALVFLCTVPVYLGQEAQVLGVWDGGLTILLVSLVLTQLTNLPVFRTFSAPARLAITDSLLLFTNPLFGVAAFAATLEAARRAWTLRRALIFGAIAAACLACSFGPWAWRNSRVLGSAILTRSNGGLELSLATNPMMLTDTPHNIAFTRRIEQIHPSSSERAYAEVRRVGEVAYSRELGADAWKWIKAHPWDELRLIVLHLRNIFAPQPWIFRVWSTPNGSSIRSILASTTGLLGLAGMVFGLLTNRRSWAPTSIIVLFAALLFSPFQPITRYIYLFYAIFAFSAAFAIDQIFSLLLYHAVQWRASDHSPGRDFSS